MGEKISKWYSEKCLKEYKIAFLATFIIGLLTHIYKFTNTLLNHDSLFNFYNDQNAIHIGRWLLSIASGISSYFDFPWVIGLFSLILISMTTVIIVRLFHVKNRVLIILCGGILVSFPSVTQIFIFEYTADGYMMALLLSALSVYLIRFEEKRWQKIILGGVCLCLSCGIYQAYVSFALMLVLCLIIWELLEHKRGLTEILKWMGTRIVVFVAALGTYYVVWKICLFFQGATSVDYQGVSKVGISSLPTVFEVIKAITRNIVIFFLEFDVIKYKTINLYGVLNIFFLIAALVVLVTAVIRSRIYKEKLKCLLILVMVLIMPVCIWFWSLTSNDVLYCVRMEHSIAVLYIFVLLLADRWMRPRFSAVVGILTTIIVFNYFLAANTTYYILNKTYEQSYATGVEMMMRIHEKQSEHHVDKVAFVGDALWQCGYDQQDPEWKVNLIVRNSVEKNLLFDAKHCELYLKNIFDLNLAVADQEQTEQISKSPEVQKMKNWPDTNSVRVIDDTVVIKLGEISDSQ